MKVYSGKHKNMAAVIAENDVLKLAVLPVLGGKIASLVYKPRNFEVLFQPTADKYSMVEYGSDFGRWDTSGADEMYPTIDACSYPFEAYNGVRCPDHGEVWSIPWCAEYQVASDWLMCRTNGIKLPYRFSRTIRLDGAAVRMEYRVKNLGNKPLHGLWAFHGLAACDDATEVTLPPARGRAQVAVLSVQDSDLLGPAGRVLDFPVHKERDRGALNIARVRPPLAQDTRKIYVNGPVAKGEASMTLDKGRLEYALRWPEDKAPYLGVWFDEGGFKNEHNCALEPSTGFYDSLERAAASDSVEPIAPGSYASWWLEIALRPL